MAKLIIYHLFATAVVLICSQHRRRGKDKKRKGRCFWIQPLFADRATNGAYQTLVLKIKGVDRQKPFWICSHVTELIWPFIRTYKACDYEKECN